MQEQHSRTALAAAFYRAQHHLSDEPKVIDDPFAHRLLTAGEVAAIADRCVRDGMELGVTASDREQLLARTLRTVKPAAFVLARARYTEDRLAMAIQRGVDQYVLVGAGLDSFAFRDQSAHGTLQIFELDHPQSQAFKRKRLAAAGLSEPANLHFGAIDFERENIGQVLSRLPFHTDAPALFAWLGVTMYLTRAAIDNTLRAVREVAASGSEFVFDFIAASTISNGSERMKKLRERTRAIGEEIITGIDPRTLAAELEATGWKLIEQLDGAEIHRRWFAARDDGYAPPRGHLACAGVV